MTPIEKSAAIIAATHDGNDLSVIDLRLCELAANNRLSDTGKTAFNALYESVSSGNYQKKDPVWHFGIVGLTKSGDGYVKWKGTTVEHYSFGDAEEEKVAAENLAAHCRLLESNGFPVSWRTASAPEIYGQAPAGTPWREAMLSYYSFFSDRTGKATWAIFSLPEHAAVAVRMQDGQPETRFAYATDGAFGTYNMFHELQNEGFASCSNRVRTYQDLVEVLNEVGIQSDQLDAILASGAPEVETEQSAPAMM